MSSRFSLGCNESRTFLAEKYSKNYCWIQFVTDTNRTFQVTHSLSGARQHLMDLPCTITEGCNWMIIEDENYPAD